MPYALIAFILPGLGEWLLGARWNALGSLVLAVLAWTSGSVLAVLAVHGLVAALTGWRAAEAERA